MYKYREEWLENAVAALKPMFDKAGLYMPEIIKVSCGWPYGDSSVALGTCASPECSKGHLREIFISPLLGQEELLTKQGVFATLVHEIAHACFDHDEKHGANFAKAAKELKLEWQRITATSASDELIELCRPIAEQLGAYPNPGMTLVPKKTVERVKNIKTLRCTDQDCGYEMKIHIKFLEKAQPKACPACESELYFKD